MTDQKSDLSRRHLLTAGMGAASAVLLASGCQALRPAAARPTLTGQPQPLDLAPDADIRCGIIGVGGRGTGVLRAIHNVPKVRVTAVCDLNQENLDRAMGIVADDQPTAFGDYQQMLKSDLVDTVFVMTPCYLHAPMAIAVLESGRHCYCEKPMAINTRDLDRMVRTVQDTGKVLQVGTQLPHASPWHGAIKAVHDGEIGEPVLIHAQSHNAGDLPHHIPWFFKRKLSGDTILEQAVHEFDIFNAIFKGVPTQASASGGQAVLFDPPGRDIMDHYGLILDYGKNQRVVYTHSWIAIPKAPHGGRVEMVYGTKGCVDVEAGMIYPRDGEPRKVNPEPAGDSTQVAVQNFFDCVRQGKHPLTDVIRGRDGALVALLGLKAIDTNRVVTMQELLAKGYSA